jgi:hypothetical protein
MNTDKRQPIPSRYHLLRRLALLSLQPQPPGGHPNSPMATGSAPDAGQNPPPRPPAVPKHVSSACEPHRAWNEAQVCRIPLIRSIIQLGIDRVNVGPGSEGVGVPASQDSRIPASRRDPDRSPPLWETPRDSNPPVPRPGSRRDGSSESGNEKATPGSSEVASVITRRGCAQLAFATRRRKPMPTRPRPRRARVPGSGTLTGLPATKVKLAVSGTPGLP